MRLQLAMIFAKDFAGMAAFYGETLGLAEVAGSRTESWVEFDAGGVRLGLHAIPPEIASGIEIASPAEAREDTPLKLVFAARDWEAECQRLEDLGVRVMVRRGWGADLLDPEGNVFHLTKAG